MTIEIEDNITLSEVADIFNKYYPFLSLEFYSKPHQWQEESSSKNILAKNTLIGDCRDFHKTTFIDVYFWNKTGTIEQSFKNKAGLHVQIFRKNGSKWVQTVGTDELTIEEQNNLGRKSVESEVGHHADPIEWNKKL